MPQIIIRNAAIERFLNEIASAFQAEYPQVYARFLAHVKRESLNLIKPSGMSRDGHFMSFMYLPSELYTFIKHQAQKRLGIDDFFRDSANYRLLCKVWPDAVPHRRPTQYLRVTNGAKPK